MKSLKIMFVFALMAITLLNANAQLPANLSGNSLFTTKYTKDKVWDVQRSPAYPVAGQDWTLSGLKGALDFSGASIDWGYNRYVMFSLDKDISRSANSLTDDINGGAKYNLALKLYESNGKLVKVISKWGKFIGVGSLGFMYEVEGMFGTFFSVNAANSSSVIKYKPSFATITKLSELFKGTEQKGIETIKGITDAPSFMTKYTKNQVWDVQRSPAYPTAGQDWVLTGLKAAYDASGSPIDWGYGRYVMLVADEDNSRSSNSLVDDVNNSGKKYNVALKLFESNGTLVKVLSKWGKIVGIGAQGFMYEEEGSYGTFFSASTVSSSSVVTYKPSLASVTRMSELVKVYKDNKQKEEPNNNPGNSQAQITTGYYTLTARCSGKVLDVLDGSKADGAKIQQWKLNGNIAQHWKIEPVSGDPGYYTLTAKCSGKVLDVLDGSKADGAKIQQWKLNGNQAQHWKIEPVRGASGYYILVSRTSGKVLDVLDGSKNDGATIQQWKLNGNIAQHWKLDMVGGSTEPFNNNTNGGNENNKGGKRNANTETTGIEVGQLATDITMNDVNGNSVSLSSLRGKIVLVDFWASWCAPCRAENPNNVAMYAKFKNKGFEILGVSLDNAKSNWQAAIQKDNLTWINVSDLAGWDNAAAKVYGIRSIPATVLIDKDGKIIAKGLRGKSLQFKLEQLLGK
jgi:peroxiredoxin